MVLRENDIEPIHTSSVHTEAGRPSLMQDSYTRFRGTDVFVELEKYFGIASDPEEEIAGGHSVD